MLTKKIKFKTKANGVMSRIARFALFKRLCTNLTVTLSSLSFFRAIHCSCRVTLPHFILVAMFKMTQLFQWFILQKWLYIVDRQTPTPVLVSTLNWKKMWAGSEPPPIPTTLFITTTTTIQPSWANDTFSDLSHWYFVLFQFFHHINQIFVPPPHSSPPKNRTLLSISCYTTSTTLI